MITVLLAEKDDQAATYAAALGEGRKKGMTWIVQQSPYLEGEIHIVAAEGHLFEYESPNNNWDLEKLPLLVMLSIKKLKNQIVFLLEQILIVKESGLLILFCLIFQEEKKKFGNDCGFTL